MITIKHFFIQDNIESIVLMQKKIEKLQIVCKRSSTKDDFIRNINTAIDYEKQIIEKGKPSDKLTNQFINNYLKEIFKNNPKVVIDEYINVIKEHDPYTIWLSLRELIKDPPHTYAPPSIEEFSKLISKNNLNKFSSIRMDLIERAVDYSKGFVGESATKLEKFCKENKFKEYDFNELLELIQST